MTELRNENDRHHRQQSREREHNGQGKLLPNEVRTKAYKMRYNTEKEAAQVLLDLRQTSSINNSIDTV